MKTHLFKIFSGILIAVYLSSVALSGMASATPNQFRDQQSPPAKHEPKHGINPETGKLSFIGNGDPIEVPGVSDMRGISPQERAHGMANAYGKEFGLKNPAQELKMLKSETDNNGKDITRFQQVYKGIPVIAGEMIVNTNAAGELLSISGEVSSDLTIDTKPTVNSQQAGKTAVSDIAKFYKLNEKDLNVSSPELWIFDESLLRASTRSVELVWRMEVTANDATQPIRELVLVNAQTGIVSWHVNQVDTEEVRHEKPQLVLKGQQTLTTWPVYFDIELDESRGWIYGSDSTGNKIDVISISTLQLVKSFSLAGAANPKAIALSPDGSELAIAQFGIPSILFLMPDTGATIASITLTTSPWDVIYGRPGRLYSSGSNDYVRIIDTNTHSLIGESANTIGGTPYLAISSNKNTLFANGQYSPNVLYRFDVSTDNLVNPVVTEHQSNFQANHYVLLPDDSKIFTDCNQVWNSDLSSKIGQTTPALDADRTILGGRPAVLPNHSAVVVAVDNTSGNDILVFVSTDNFFNLTTYTLPAGTVGALIANADGTKLYVSSSNGIIVLDLTSSLPGTPVPLPSGPLPYYDLIIDEQRGVLYGSDYASDKIDVISLSTLEVVNSFRFVNGAGPKGIALSPDGNELAIAQTDIGKLLFMSPDTGETLATLPSLGSDVIYGRTNRLYTINSGIQVIDTSTHARIGVSPASSLSASYLTISSDRNTLFANGTDSLYKVDISTDSLSAPIRMTATSYFYSNRSVMLVDDTKIFTDYHQVWSSDFKSQLGLIEPSVTLKRNLAFLPNHNVIAIGTDNSYGNDEVWFASTDNFYTLTKYTLPTTGTLGSMIASADGSVLYINTSAGVTSLNLTPTLPGSPAPLPTGSLPYTDIVLDESRGMLYGADLTGNKIDVISMATLQVVKSYRLVNGAKPKAIALSPDGSELAVAQSSASSIVFLNPDTGEVLSKVIPNTPNTMPTPSDIIYGRTGRLYSVGNGYIHSIDTISHTEISKSSSDYSTGSYLAISSSKNYLYTNTINKFDVSTDSLLTPIKTTSFGSTSANSILLVDDTKILTDSKIVWNSDLNTMIGAITVTGLPANLPNHNAVAVGIDNSSGNDAIAFVSTYNFYTLFTYTLPTSGTMGPMLASSDGSKLFVNTSNGFQVIDLSSSLPGTSVPFPSGPLPYFDLVADEARGVLYGADSTSNKIDVISSSGLQVVKSFRLANGAIPHGIALSPDGNELAITQTGLYSILFLNLDTGETIASIPSLVGNGQPWDIVYGRLGRLYSSGINDSFVHIIDTVTHTEINKFSGWYGSPSLALTSDKNTLFVNDGKNYFSRFNVSSDTAVRTANSYNLSANTFLLLADDSKIFTSAGQVWSTDLTTNLGSLGVSGKLAEIPDLGLVAVLSTSSPGLITFVKTSDHTTASTSLIPSTTAIGASLASSAGVKLFVNTNNGIKAILLDPTVPNSISAYSGVQQSVQVSNPFSDPLKVKIQNILGESMPGIVVNFTAPSSGASGMFVDTNTGTTSAVTDGNGIATSPIFIANNVVGSYIVKATISNLAASADFQLINLAAISCTIVDGSGSATLFKPYKQYNCGKEAYGVAAGDFNNDNRKDVALSVRAGTGSQFSLLIFTQDGIGNLSQPHIYTAGNRSESLVVGDINNDGLDDVITADFSDNKISVFLQRSDGILSNRITYPTDIGPDSMAIGDINNDGLKDIIISYYADTPSIGVFTQNVNGTLNQVVAYASVETGSNDIAIGDVNGDGLSDVVKMNGSGLYVSLLVYLQNTNHTLNPYISYSLANCTSYCSGNGLSIGDITGDARADIVMSYGGNSPSGKIVVFPQDLNGNLQTSISYSAYDIPDPVEIADVNSDNLLDVIVLHSGWLKAGVFLQQTNGSLSTEALYSIPYSTWYESQALSTSDINNDNLPDLLVADAAGLVILYRNAVIPSTLTPVVTSTSGPGPSPTPKPSFTPGPSPTPVPSSSTGNRNTYTSSGGTTLPGTFLCDQSQSICTNGADPDADKAHQYAADTFMFYNIHHHRNSFDNQGGTINSTVHYGVGYQNAFWTGSQMVYGDNMAADDVVGHELTHGVTQYTSGLIYYGQSGAINESFSDVWGEFIDQTNGSGNDSPSVKWLMGEDTPLGAIRSMSNPPTYGDPDRMSSPYYYTGPYDNGGVHINSGVNNKAAYLMVDGDTFNGRTILGIGLHKTAAIYYEAQANLLTAGANYNDLYYALNQACQNLTGGPEGITQNDCVQVQLAAEAVEMIPALLPTPTPTATLTFTPTDTATSTPTNTPTPTNTFTPTATPPYSYNPLYLSFTGSQTIGGVSSADEDILKFDGQNWSMFFDGSDVGVSSSDVFAFALLDDDSLLLSFNSSVTVNGITATAQDVLRFDATSLGSTTAGTFSMYFDGSDVGFDTSSESIDSLSLLPDGRLLFSTTSSPSVPGLTTGKDEDVLAFTPTSLGTNTAGTWSMYFDGSDVGLAESSNEDVDALDIAGGKIYLSTIGDFAVPDLTGADEDVFICVPTSIGDVTSCNYTPALYFDGSTWGVSANDVDAFNLLVLGGVPTSTPVTPPTNTPTLTPSATFTAPATNTQTPTATSGPTSTPTNTPTPGATSTNTSTPTATSTPLPTFTSTPTSSASNTLFADGFESGNFLAWSAATTGGDGLAIVQNSVVHAGNYSANLSETVNTGSLAYLRKSLSAPETNLTISGDFMLTQEGVSGGNVPIFRIFDTSSTRLLNLYRQNATNGQVWSYDGITRIQSSTLMPLNTWVHFDLHVITNGAGASTIDIYMNGTRVIQTTTASLGTAGVLTVQIGNDTSKQTFTLYADDISMKR